MDFLSEVVAGFGVSRMTSDSLGSSLRCAGVRNGHGKLDLSTRLRVGSKVGLSRLDPRKPTSPFGQRGIIALFGHHMHHI